MTKSQINVSDCIINSGYCSGRNSVKNIPLPTKGSCMGTVRSYCVESGSRSLPTFPDKKVNSGAFSGAKVKSEGSAGKGNLGNQPHGGHQDSEVIGTCWSFNIGIPSERKPFNAIEKNTAVIRGDYCAGPDKSVEPALEAKGFKSDNYNCKGTEYSFNAVSGKEINAKGATLNTGAFAGIGGS